MPERLTKPKLAEAVQKLIARDKNLRAIHEQFGLPELWNRKPGFETLVQIILEQQVSLASGRAVMDKLKSAIDDVTPKHFLRLSEADLRNLTFSRQKARYCRILAEAIQGGDLNLRSVDRLDDDGARAELTKLTGIGTWTANVYLLMALRRPDVWPTGDRALAVAARDVLQLDDVPTYPELDEIAERWRPYRGVAARMLWLHYLSD